MKKQVAVIGGGAAGLTAAVWAARSGAQVTVIEHTDRVGKKILSTGNGRCNLTNARMEEEHYYCGESGFVAEVLRQFSWKDTLRWFSSMGVLCKARMETYYYPVSDQASAVLDALRLEVERLGVSVLTEWKTESIRTERKKGRLLFWVCSGKEKLCFDAVVLACGSRAAPNTGSDGSGYALAAALGHSVIKPLPALVQLRCQGNYYKALAGIRTEAKLTLVVDGKQERTEEGELQITDYGLSGIPVFQMSRFAARALDERKKVQVIVDFLPFMGKEETRVFLRERLAALGWRRGEDFFTGVVNKKLALILLKMAGIRPDDTMENCTKRQRELLFRGLKEYEALVSSVNAFSHAQVCCGGVDAAQVDAHTLESRLVPGLFFAGEILDVDGRCGGYNLQWAWSSGKVAGSRAAGWSQKKNGGNG